MDNLLTTRQLQDLLKVDRITIYRMLSDGRLNGIKVGNHWRFPINEVEKILERGTPREKTAALSNARSNFPSHCVQALQDVFADIGQVSAVTIDPDGFPLTESSHPCLFCELLHSNPAAHQACLASWNEIAGRVQNTREPEYLRCHAGLDIAAGPIVFEGQYIGCMLAEGFFARPPDSNEINQRIRSLSRSFNLQPQVVSDAIHQVPTLSDSRFSQVLNWPRQVARSILSILSERSSLAGRLQRIAEITGGG